MKCEDLFFALHLILGEKWSTAEVKTSSFSLHPILVEKRSSANVKTFPFCSSADLSGKIGLCEHENLFCSLTDFSGKTTQGSILSHIFQKGAIVQKKLKAPVLALKNLGKFLLT